MSYQSELYQQVVLEHNKNPRNFRKLEKGSHSCDGNNPLCGDKYTVYLSVNEKEIIEDISFIGSGCAISKSSASLMTSFLKGKTIEEARIIFNEFHKMILGELNIEEQKNRLGKLKVFKGVRQFPSRTKCATLPWHTFVCALEKQGETILE